MRSNAHLAATNSCLRLMSRFRVGDLNDNEDGLMIVYRYFAAPSENVLQVHNLVETGGEGQIVVWLRCKGGWKSD